MKVYIDGSYGNSSVGYFFASFRAIAGDRVTNNPSNADVVLCGPSQKGRYGGKPNIFVQRLDGIYFDADDPSRSSTKNRSIISLYKKANGVIFQSNYAKNLVEKQFGRTKAKTCVIYNGTDIKDKYLTRFPKRFSTLHELRNNGNKLILCCGTNRPIKRYQSILDGFNEYKNRNPHAILVVAGTSMTGFDYSSRIYGVGSLPHGDMLSLYTGVDLLVNLSFSDACPNVVVEALACKVPVLMTTYQGTTEIYEGNGYVLQEPARWDLSTVSYKKIPSLSPAYVADGIEKALSIGFKKPLDLSMEKCVNQYLKFCESL